MVPLQVGLVGSPPHCVPTLVGNPLLWGKSVSSGISSLRVPPHRWDAAIFTAMLGSPHAAWHHPTPDQQLQRPLAQLMVWTWPHAWAQNPPTLWYPGPRSWGCWASCIDFPACASPLPAGLWDTRTVLQPALPPLPGCSQSLVNPHQHCGVARQPGPGPGADPQPRQKEHGAGCVGRHVPSRRPRLRSRAGCVWSRTLVLASTEPARPRCDGDTCVGRPGSQIPALLWQTGSPGLTSARGQPSSGTRAPR